MDICLLSTTVCPPDGVTTPGLLHEEAAGQQLESLLLLLVSMVHTGGHLSRGRDHLTLEANSAHLSLQECQAFYRRGPQLVELGLPHHPPGTALEVTQARSH